MEDFHSELFENDLWSSNIKPESNTDSNDSTHQSTTSCKLKKTYKKRSYIWTYYRKLQNSDKGYECIVCNRIISGSHIGNLTRHLSLMHNLTNLTKKGSPRKKPSSSKSFIWKYCTKESEETARCHFCNKILYFGGGNTTNISKHLWRKHKINLEEMGKDKANYGITRSYVWKYIEKVSSQIVRCVLCERDMRFHGTANLIHHLERVHRITDIFRCKKTKKKLADKDESEDDESSDETDKLSKKPKTKTNVRSLCWKYYQSIGPDMVRCSFCKRDFANLGTSNLRRHLQRMHGVLNDTLDDSKKSISSEIDEDELINKMFTPFDEVHIKCKMCDDMFNKNAKNIILNHLKRKHRLTSKDAIENAERFTNNIEKETLNLKEESFNQNKSESPSMNYDELDIKKYFDIYGEADINEEETRNDFENENLLEMPLSNPLSPHSSADHFVNLNEYKSTDKNSQTTLNELQEERLKAETEYFREKAGFYRMQKNLTVLQAKKVRLELENYKKQNLETISE